MRTYKFVYADGLTYLYKCDDIEQQRAFRSDSPRAWVKVETLGTSETELVNLNNVVRIVDVTDMMEPVENPPDTEPKYSADEFFSAEKQGRSELETAGFEW